LRVRLPVHIANPPPKPLLIFDGDCRFCGVWVRRWQHITGDRVEYLPFQDPSIPQRCPEVPVERFETAVHLVEPNGLVYSGAEAVFRTLSWSEDGSLLLDWYLTWPGFAKWTETAYRFVANHRTLFSALTRAGWGDHAEPSTYRNAGNVFIRSLGVIYLIAFVSLWSQIMGLIGSNGILPANLTMFGFRQEANVRHMGWQRYVVLPTLCWFSASDGALKAQCAAGTCLAILVILGISPAPCLFLLWLIYLSLATVSREFLSYQWDSLLLETGFLAIFLAPLQLLIRKHRVGEPPHLVVWLLRWLLFRLMFESGLVKLLAADPTWRNLTALKFHYETQPLPTWAGWYAHQLPLTFQRFSTFSLFVVELGLPFFIFAPRRPRRIACGGFVLLQLLILLTGNYCFFNLLTILLCLMLLDDAALPRLIPNKLRTLFEARFNTQPKLLPQASPAQPDPPPSPTPKYRRWPIQVTFPLACVSIVIPFMALVSFLPIRIVWSRPLVKAFEWTIPFRSFNRYGLFAEMTTNRFEIVVQGSNDGVHWLDYDFKYKPGDLKRGPGFVEPHQPRLDWQMWFAALGDYQHNFWFVEFCVRLLNGSPEVLALMGHNPFPQRPPMYLRAVVYEYHFTDWATRRRTGAWWRREARGSYLPVLSRRTEIK
jgi:lipase maturation factor 1